MLEGVVFSPKDESAEGYFSWHQCENCGDKMGGNRFDIVYRETLTGPILEASVCQDCYIEFIS